MEHMGKQAAVFDVSPVDCFHITSTSSAKVTALPEFLLDELSDALIHHLPNKKVCLNPTILSTHNMDMSHLLRTSKKNREESRQQDKLNGNKLFLVLMDTGCSVSCSGFVKDFHGKLAFGDFGTVSTANSAAKIEGFGMLCWDIISDMGKRVTILVPGYYSPTVKMHLLSPQDYAKYHHLEPNKPQCQGNVFWM